MLAADDEVMMRPACLAPWPLWPYDLDGNGVVNILDVASVASWFGSTVGPPDPPSQTQTMVNNLTATTAVIAVIASGVYVLRKKR